MRYPVLISALAATNVAPAMQPPRRIDLIVPEAVHPHPFTRINALRELPDGRLLIADEQEGDLILADFRTQSASPVGRRGQGPQEYLIPRGLIALPGGRTLLQDPGNARFLELDAEGRIARSLEPQGAAGTGRPDIMLGLNIAWDVRGSDRRGNIYFEQLPGVLRLNETVTVPIVRWNVERRMLDTVANYRLTEAMLSQSVSSGKPGEVLVRPRAWPARLQWAVSSDGRVAIVEPEPYRLVWMEAGGRRAGGGPPVSFTAERVSEADREWYLEEMNASQARARGLRRPSAPQPRPAGAGQPTAKRGGAPIFPASFPAFAGRDAVRIDADGTVWVARSHSVNATASLYDLFDGSARRHAQAHLRARSRIVGFGNQFIYVARRDDDDLEHLERYRR